MFQDPLCRFRFGSELFGVILQSVFYTILLMKTFEQNFRSDVPRNSKHHHHKQVVFHIWQL